MAWAQLAAQPAKKGGQKLKKNIENLSGRGLTPHQNQVYAEFQKYLFGQSGGGDYGKQRLLKWDANKVKYKNHNGWGINAMFKTLKKHPHIKNQKPTKGYTFTVPEHGDQKYIAHFHWHGNKGSTRLSIDKENGHKDWESGDHYIQVDTAFIKKEVMDKAIEDGVKFAQIEYYNHDDEESAAAVDIYGDKSLLGQNAYIHGYKAENIDYGDSRYLPYQQQFEPLQPYEADINLQYILPIIIATMIISSIVILCCFMAGCGMGFSFSRFINGGIASNKSKYQKIHGDGDGDNPELLV